MGALRPCADASAVERSTRNADLLVTYYVTSIHRLATVVRRRFEKPGSRRKGITPGLSRRSIAARSRSYCTDDQDNSCELSRLGSSQMNSSVAATPFGSSIDLNLVYPCLTFPVFAVFTTK